MRRSGAGLNAVLGQAAAIRARVLPALAALRALVGPGASALNLLAPALADVALPAADAVRAGARGEVALIACRVVSSSP